jgi:hypothetical protein
MRIRLLIAATLLALLPLAGASARNGSDDQPDSGKATQIVQTASADESQAETENEAGTPGSSNKASFKTDGKGRRLTEKQQQRCERVAALIATKAQRADSHRVRMDQAYSTVETRWQRLVDRATAAGVSTTDLTAAITEFKTMHIKFDTDFASFEALQRQLKTVDKCSDPAQIKTLKDQANTAKNQVKQDAMALRTFRQKTQSGVIVPLLKQLAKASGTKADSSKETSDDTKTQ